MGATLITKTANVTPVSTDVTYTVNDPGGSPADRKVTLANLVTKAHGLSDGAVNISAGVMGTGVTSIANGGTGQITAQLGINALTNVAAATNEYVLTKDTATGNAVFKTLAGAGQTLVSWIVAPSGGTHTTLGAAIAAASAGDTIYVREGTYSESAITSATTQLTIIGENPESSIISMGANNLTLSGTGLTVQNCQITTSGGVLTFSGALQTFVGNIIKSSSNATGTIAFSNTDKCVTSNQFHCTSGTAGFRVIGSSGDRGEWHDNFFLLNHESSTGTQGVVEIYGNFTKFHNNFFRCTAGTSKRPAIGFGKVSGSQYGSFVGNTITVESNTGGLIVGSSSSGILIANNTFYISGVAIDVAGSKHTISGNTVYAQTNAAGDYGVVLTGGTNHTITGNTLAGGGTTSTMGINVSGSNTDCVISGNVITNWATGITFASGSNYNNASGNTFSTVTTPIADSGLANDAYNNSGASVVFEKRHVYMKNTSAATINAGNLVVWKAVAAGNEITTTVTAGDDKVFGVATAQILNNASGYIQILGKTTLLTADGTTDIAVGDFLTAFTTAGIVAKAAAGDQCIAIALEAYTTNDSNGVLDALIINPRMI